jgi:GNAT superfamily N-acetyltransferase
MVRFMANLDIRRIGPDEFGLVWPIFREVVRAADTFCYDPDTSYETARDMWTTPPKQAFAAWEGDRVVGCYTVSPNQGGPGDHVANGSYMVASDARGRGVAGELCEHSLATARTSGFQAMQFNAVVARNEPAVHVWQKHGFVIVGRVPRAFRHPRHGLTDLLIMHRYL